VTTATAVGTVTGAAATRADIGPTGGCTSTTEKVQAKDERKLG